MINIIEIQQTMTQGMTKPWLCEADDDNLYVVKRKNAGWKGCVNEWIAGNLGKLVGLNIPNIELVYIDDALVEYNIDLEVGLGAGDAFASLYTKNLQEVNVDILKAADQLVLRDLYLFDCWVKNGDRTLGQSGGNPNLFHNLVNGSLVVFDHNLAFDTDFSIAEHKTTHLARHIFKGQADMFNDDDIRTHYTGKFNQALLGLDDIIRNIPNEWLDEIPDALGEIERIRLVLNEFQTDNFWEALL